MKTQYYYNKNTYSSINYLLISISLLHVIKACNKNTDCMKTCYMGQDLCYMQHTFPGEADEGFCKGGSFFSDGNCVKKKSLNKIQCETDNNFCVTRLCSNNKCKHRTSGCASLADCAGSFVSGDYFQGETSNGVESFVKEHDDETTIENIKENCDNPTGGPHCFPQPCNGYGRLRKKNKRRRLSNIELIDNNTPGRLISRTLLNKIHSNISHIERRKLIETLDEIKKLLSEGLIIKREIDTCYYIFKENQFIKPNKTCETEKPSIFYKNPDIDICKDRECTATGDFKICVKGPVYFSITPNFKFDLTTFNFGIGAGFLFDASSLEVIITSTGSVECSFDRDWTLTSKVILFKKPIKFGSVSIMIEINGQITARVRGELSGTSKTEFSLNFKQFELADSFQLGLNMKNSEDNCIDIEKGVSIPDPPNLPKTGPRRRLRVLKQKRCNEAKVFGRLLMKGILKPKHRKLLDIKFKPSLNHIKSSGKAKAKLTASVQGEFSLIVNGVQAEVGIGGDLSFVAEADGSAKSDDDTCIKSTSTIVGGLRIGTYIPSFDLVQTVTNFGLQQCKHSLGLLNKIRRRRLNDNKDYISIFHQDKISILSIKTLKWIGYKSSKDWHMKVIEANRRLNNRYGDMCNSKYNNRKEIVKNELKSEDGRKGICKILIDFGLNIVGNPEICVKEFSKCEILYTMDTIELGEVNSGCGGDGIVSIEDYKCEPFKTHIEEIYKSSCQFDLDWVLIVVLIVVFLVVAGGSTYLYKNYK